ncbi:HAD-IC family P-type ATPase [Arthrobacter dokdonensis]|uniref:HAD-IC family P-type ATPase n=1 Tax=Arthrobacter dokdonellae TaxID=2211210 RepID=UPI001D1307E0|nr:HAD-IC family P-type ATPase [Arthrobacter dokdonellae]
MGAKPPAADQPAEQAAAQQAARPRAPRDLTRSRPRGTVLAERRDGHQRAALAAAREALAPVDAAELERNGLDPAQVRERQVAELGNAVAQGSSRSIWAIVRSNVFTLFNAVLGSALALVLLVGDPRDALFGFIVLANAAIGVVQEYRAKRTLDRLAVLHAPQALVRRDGGELEVAVADVLFDDVLLLRTGDQIPADAVIFAAESLEIDESLLTGESDPVVKGAGDTALSGSAVVAGHGAARVHRVGAESYASALTAEARRFSLVNSEIRNSINRIILYIAWALIPIIVLVVNGQMNANGGWAESLASGRWRTAVISAVASVVAMIPEGLVLLTSISFGMAAVKLARRQVLVQELPAVEGLARVDMVCLDKTGTLTEGRMELAGTTVLAPVPGWESVLAWCAAHPNANATAAALAADFTNTPAAEPVAVVPFSSVRKYSAVTFAPGPVMRPGDGAGAEEREGASSGCEAADSRGTWVFGAPDVVLAGSADGPGARGPGADATVAASRDVALAASRDAALAESHEAAGRGLRAVVLAHRPAPGAPAPDLTAPDMTAPDMTAPDMNAFGADDGDFDLSGLRPVALLVFREKVRADAGATLAYFREQGVGLKVISGDNPRTVAAVARSVGMSFSGDGYDARGLPEEPAALADVLERECVLGRVTPEQKKAIVLALQASGHVVAMTGDGVNDALALKHADMGIAMGSGAAATKAVSRLVLLDGQFSHLPSVVAEGRRVIANVERVANLFLSKTAYAVLISIAIGILLWRYPFLPRQLSIVSSMTIGIPAFFLALLPNARRYQPGFLRRALMFSIPAGTIVAACIMAVYSFALAFPEPGLSPAQATTSAQTATTVTVLLVALWVLGALARPFDFWRALLVAAIVAALVLVMVLPFARNFFALDIPSGPLLAVTIGVTATGCLAVELLYRFLKKRGAVSERE